jgi:uncharacterized protein (TIGR02145 family)
MARVLLLIDRNNPFPADLEKVLSAGGYDVCAYDITNHQEFDSELLCDADICVVSLPGKPIAFLATGWMRGKEKKVVAYASNKIAANEANNAFDGIAHSLRELVGLVKTTLMKSMVPIDLGLSVLWADRNLGAATADDFGLYVQRRLIRKGVYGLVNHRGEKVCIPKGWRLPTADDFSELIQECKIEHCVDNGAKVVGPSAESVMFKYGGCYFEQFNLKPEEENDSGFFLSETRNWNGNIKYLFLGSHYNRYQHWVVNDGNDQYFVNIRLVKDKERPQ